MTVMVVMMVVRMMIRWWWWGWWWWWWWWWWACFITPATICRNHSNWISVNTSFCLAWSTPSPFEIRCHYFPAVTAQFLRNLAFSRRSFEFRYLYQIQWYSDTVYLYPDTSSLFLYQIGCLQLFSECVEGCQFKFDKVFLSWFLCRCFLVGLLYNQEQWVTLGWL